MHQSTTGAVPAREQRRQVRAPFGDRPGQTPEQKHSPQVRKAHTTQTQSTSIASHMPALSGRTRCAAAGRSCSSRQWGQRGSKTYPFVELIPVALVA